MIEWQDADCRSRLDHHGLKIAVIEFAGRERQINQILIQEPLQLMGTHRLNADMRVGVLFQELPDNLG
ncbi:hypothetical protein SDC9_207012 [bioreactor metagenome]|uniref:Uncharacterized protein n=1 Tax=bioreactor metagenome TaxID=1076179 RepID=A0A645J6P7_9ZZZZ